MLISREWLSQLVDFDDLSTEQFSELITTRVAEVDKVHLAAEPTAAGIVVAIKSAVPHPTNDKLKVVTVQTGSEEVQVVCGAPNVTPHSLAVFLPPGAKFYAAGAGEASLRTVEQRAAGGVESNGVLVSEAELGVTADHSGLLVIDDELLASGRRGGRSRYSSAAAVVPGTGVSEILGGPDAIIEIDNKSLTHRPDLWSHFGFAREISAILNRPLKFNADTWADFSESGAEKLLLLGKGRPPLFTVRVERGSGCRRFAAIAIDGVSPAQSPFWMRRRLFSVGAGVRNILVDLSNYVMHELGQPNHAYDAEKLQGSEIVIRRAAEGEPFAALDGKTYDLGPEDIAICDRAGVVALGGVIGGGPSAVSETTKALLLESANFDPVLIRRTAKRHQVRTDASNRFEKSLSPFAVPLAIHRFIEILTAFSPTVTVAGVVSDDFAEQPPHIQVPYRPDYIQQRLGYKLGEDRVGAILTSLGFKIREGKLLDVPYYRATRDVSIEDDLVEEVGRISGYENVPERAPKIASQASSARSIADLEYLARDILTAQGFSELYLYSFMNRTSAEQLGYETSDAIALENPVDLNENLIRTTLVPGMLRQAALNARHFRSMLMYEVGRAYSKRRNPRHEEHEIDNVLKNQAAFETRLLTIAYSSGLAESDAEAVTGSVPPLSRGADFFALRTIVERIVRAATGAELKLRPIGPGDAPAAGEFRSWMHPCRAAALTADRIPIGVMAEVRPRAIADLPDERVVVAEIDLELLQVAHRGVPQFKPLPRFPVSLFEMSVVMPHRAHYEELERLLQDSAPDGLLKRVEVISVYEGKPLKEGQKSISVKLHLGADDRTLSSDELSTAQATFIAAIESSNFSLRM